MEPYENQKRRNIVQERPAKKPYNGLKNQGATCYLNSILQCLYMTEDFRQEVERFVPDQRNHAKESLMQELQKLFKEMKKGDCKIEGITRMLGITNVYEQEDVVEYYQKTLKAIGQQSSKIFEGKMSNKTKCIKDHIFEEECHFFTIPLSIEVEHNEVFKVHNGLHTFLERIKLDEDNWLYCKQCGQKNETETWNEIKELPKILTLYPKRFYFDYYKMRPVKNHCPMDIPLQLVMSPNLKYELYAVINHIGNERGGHYNAVIKSFEDGKWYCFDDTSVREDSESSFRLSQQAYLLMYRNVEVDRLSPDEKSTNEYYELFTTLLQRIQHFISVFKESKFPSNYKETEILCHQFLDFKKKHLLEIEAYKKHCYKTFEVAVQAGQIKVHPSYHTTNVEEKWCLLQTAIIERERLLTKEFKRVYYFHHHLLKQCRGFSVPLTQPELDKAKICYIQDLLVWLENKQIQIQNMEWGADLQSNGFHLGITLHQSIIDFKSNIDHAHADEIPTNRQAYRSYLDELDIKYKILLELHKTKKNLKQCHHNFMSNRQDSEPGLSDECKQADYNNLPQSLEQEHDESVCKSYITRIKSLRLSLLNYGTYIISCFKQTAFSQDTSKQKEIQTMLENMKKEFDALTEATLTSAQQSTWEYNLLCWEIDFTAKELKHVYLLFSDYCKAMGFYLKEHSTQDTGDVHKTNENQLSDVLKVHANEKEMASNQELLTSSEERNFNQGITLPGLQTRGGSRTTKYH
ncbi:ubiquitin carboxyl-terminal hydrolase 47-like isoform X2 [Tachysurus fulvidraco]|uniref:ubiquitin carboxyl-terminal hydrolase 47-like isoform X2 n=1 Tax=Tachysurus fulvidraco TaxID=1234273 RepID=UPI001FEE06CD|nr:ubiquitin carboxyl-terminal hydrolase 47-like isoform X2 [Tachysurus fulvidraco]